MADSRNHSHHHYHIGLIILIILVGLVGFKFLTRQHKWNTYVVQSQQTVNQHKQANSVEDAGVIAATIVSVPAPQPIFNNPTALQAYVTTISNKTGRDIVIIDNNKEVLAATVPGKVGDTYNFDQNDVISKTLSDGIARQFVEKSVDYPNGIEETVVAFKDNKGAVVGAVIISPSKFFN